MSGQNSVLGFTEAELGFFLALLCIVLWVSATAAELRPKAVLKPPPRSTITLDSARLLEKRISRLQRLVDSLKSPILPSCESKHVINGPLVSLIALPGGNFRLDGETVALGEIAEITAPSRTKARSDGCVHAARLGFVESMSAPEYEMARRQIGSLGLRLIAGEIVKQ
jgi:hypothetical protein